MRGDRSFDDAQQAGRPNSDVVNPGFDLRAS